MKTIYALNSRWLLKWGLRLASERRTRTITQQLAPYDIAGELMPFVFTANDGEEIRTAPCVYTPDLFSCMEMFLEKLSRYASAVSMAKPCMHLYRNLMLKTDDSDRKSVV